MATEPGEAFRVFRVLRKLGVDINFQGFEISILGTAESAEVAFEVLGRVTDPHGLLAVVQEFCVDPRVVPHAPHVPDALAFEPEGWDTKKNRPSLMLWVDARGRLRRRTRRKVNGEWRWLLTN